MRGWPSLAGLILLLPALLFGIRRSSETLSSVADMADREVPGIETVAVDPPAVERIAAATRSDSIAARPTALPRRSPFRRVASPPVKSGGDAAPPGKTVPGDGIPRVEAVLADHGRIAAVLRVGSRRSGPLGRGESFEGWEVVDVGWESVLVGRKGVLYTLDTPDPPAR